MFKALLYLLVLVIFTGCNIEINKDNKEFNLQTKLHKLSVESQKDYNASVVYIAVMNSSNGNLVGVVDSSTPLKAFKKDKKIFEKNMLRYTFEPGSIIKPFFYALAIDRNITSPSSVINCFNGEYVIGNKKITDYNKFDNLSAEDVVVYSSNIGIVQMTKGIDPFYMNQYLKKFGFTKPAIFNNQGLGEDTGYVPHAEKLRNEIYKATTSYGYGMRVNLLQLVRAYSVFNNGGKLVYPKDIHMFVGTEYENTVIDEPESVISAITAKKVKDTLVKVVTRGTGKKAQYKSIEVGGKTGASHMVENNIYVNKYHNMFVGFANGEKNKYIIGVLIVDPKKEIYPSKTSTVVFQKVLQVLSQNNRCI